MWHGKAIEWQKKDIQYLLTTLNCLGARESLAFLQWQLNTDYFGSTWKNKLLFFKN